LEVYGHNIRAKHLIKISISLLYNALHTFKKYNYCIPSLCRQTAWKWKNNKRKILLVKLLYWMTMSETFIQGDNQSNIYTGLQ